MHHTAAITLYESPSALSSEVHHICPNCKSNVLQAISTVSHSNRRQKTTLLLLVARLLEILLPLPLHLLILILVLLVILHSSRCPRAAVIRPRDTLVLLRQRALDIREDLDQGVVLFDGKGYTLSHAERRHRSASVLGDRQVITSKNRFRPM